MSEGIFLWEGKYIFHEGVYHSMIETVTVTLSEEVIQKLDLMRDDASCSYADIITRIVEVACEDDFLSDEDMDEISASLDAIRQGEYYTDDDVSLMIAAKKE